jgi:death on curing protein
VKSPYWIKKRTVLALHGHSMRLDGGGAGVRDEGLLESALMRPQHAWSYSKPSLCTLAALYAHGIARNHPFVDGNKRTAFLTCAVFLERNGLRLTAGQGEAAAFVIALAAGKLEPEAFALWLSDHTQALRQKRVSPPRRQRKRRS